MGLYCTTTSLATLWGGASFTNLTATATLMITQAENEIDKRLSRRYDMSSAIFNTTTSVPPMITTLCEWLSLGFIYENTARGSADAFVRADRYIQKAYDNIDDLLNYKADLVDTSGDKIAGDGIQFKVYSNQDSYEPTFNEDNELGWTVDPDKLDDISDDRE